MLAKKLFFISSAVVLAASFLFPSTLTGFVLGWVGALFFVVGIKLKLATTKNLLIWGVVLHVIAFYWLPETIQLFGGFPLAISYVLFLLFCVVSSLQFLFFGFLYQWFSKTYLEVFRLALPCSWFISEFVCPRLFPWALANTQIVWTRFATLAELFGVIPLSALMLWCVEGVLWFLGIVLGKQPRVQVSFLFFVISIFGLLFWGGKRTEEIRGLDQVQPKVKLGLIQGNLSTSEKGDIRYLEANLDVYRALSIEAQNAGAEILLWPESVFNLWVPEDLATVVNSKFDPFPERKVPLLFGGLVYRKRKDIDQDMLREMQFQNTPEEIEEILLKRFNSAIGVDLDGNVLGMYHKRVLMPFGEYLPFATKFPSIKKLSPQTGSFNFGDRPDPIHFVLKPDLLVSIYPLICYEDLVPSLTREGVERGAKLLVNLTNDAWYGDTAAPDQHHLLASWRSIETRRYLVRVTNTGLSAVVSPLGQTLAVIPKFKEDKIVQEVKLFDTTTLYSITGDLPCWGLVVMILLFTTLPFAKSDA